jgi:hypothetical protein
MYSLIINRKRKDILDEREMIGTLFSIPLRHCFYSSMEYLKKNVTYSVELSCIFLESVKKEKVKEGRKGSELGQITRMITKLTHYKKFISELNNKDTLINSLYNMVLNYEGLGLLNGFGMSNRHGDRLFGNPETKSLSEKIR